MCICGEHTMTLLEARDNIVVPFPPPLYMASGDGTQSVGLQWQVLFLLIHFLSLKNNTYLAMLLDFNSLFPSLSWFLRLEYKAVAFNVASSFLSHCTLFCSLTFLFVMFSLFNRMIDVSWGSFRVRTGSWFWVTVDNLPCLEFDSGCLRAIGSTSQCPWVLWATLGTQGALLRVSCDCWRHWAPAIESPTLKLLKRDIRFSPTRTSHWSWAHLPLWRQGHAKHAEGF